MRSLKLMTLVKSLFTLLTFCCIQEGFSQINSPYSRYGLGDVYNSRNVTNKAMGNVSTPYADYQSINFLNPSSYSRIRSVTFDVGVEYENRSVRDNDENDRFRSANLTFNYVALGVQLMKNKAGETTWGLAFGLKPVTKMNYGIIESTRLAGIDSINTVYKGSGGANRAFVGTGFRIKGLSLGANLGILFGQQNISTTRDFINDSVSYFSSLYSNSVSYSKLYVEVGAQYDIKLSKTTNMRLGFTGHLGDDVNARADVLRETISYNGTSDPDSIDVVSNKSNIKGEINLPSGYTLGLAFEKQGKWMIGAEYEQTNWNEYRYFGQKDQVGTSTMFRVGGQFIPNPTTRKYFGHVAYRLGFYAGKDYIKVDNDQLPVWAATFGFGLPIRKWTNYSNQYTTINTSFEFGKRGSGNQPVAENFFRLNLGVSLSDLWFIHRHFD